MKSSKPKQEKTVEDGQKKIRKRKKQKFNEIRKQMEFYFTDSSLSKDRFLKQLINDSEYVPLTIFLTFNKIKSLTDSVDDIIKALSNSEMLKLSEDKTKVRRITSLKIKDNVDDFTIYVESLPRTADHDWIKNIFSAYGPVAYVSLPRYKKSKKIKEFAFVEYEQKSSVQKAINAFNEFGGVFTVEKEPEELASITTFLKEQEELKNEETDKIIKMEETSNTSVSELNESLKPEKISEETLVKDENEFTNDQNDSTKQTEELEPPNKRQKVEEPEEKIKTIKADSFIKVQDPLQEEKKSSSECDQEPPKKRIKSEESIKDKLNIIDASKTNVNENANISEVDMETIEKVETNNEDSSKEIVDLNDEKNAEQTDTEMTDQDLVTDSEQIDNYGENPKTSKKTRVRRKKLTIIKDVMPIDNISDLKIMTKLDWKRLRNKYLNLQREKLKQVKQQLKHHHQNKKITKRNNFAKNVTSTPPNNKNMNFYRAGDNKTDCDNKDIIENGESDKVENNITNLDEKQHENALNKAPLFSYEPGLIVNIKLSEPCINIKDFKGEMRQYSQVKYVDVKEGDDFAFIRVDNPASSGPFIKQIASQEYDCSILNGQSESDYWNKIQQDREEKIKKNVRVKPERVKIKILKQISHIRFDNDD